MLFQIRETLRLLIVNDGLRIHSRLDKLPLVDITIANGGAGKVAGSEHGVGEVSVGYHQVVQATLVKAWRFVHAETICQKAFAKVNLIERGVIELCIP